MKCRVCASPLGEGKFCPTCGASTPPPALLDDADPLIGRTVCDRYEIADLISIGGMGRVYRAVYRALDQEVAVKFIHPHLLGSADSVARFMVEAQVASRLNHPNIVSIHNFGRTAAAEGGHLLIAMELLTGPSLATSLRTDWPLPLSRTVDILCQTLSALADAHAQGVVHRDVKPSNILLERAPSGADHVKLIDFGIARIDTGRRLTRVGEVIGSPSYMSPEQATGQETGPTADLYAVGVMLFQMLTGVVPFTGPTPSAILVQQMSAPRPDPRTFAPDQGISAALADICRRSIAIDSRSRFPSAEAFAHALHDATSTDPWPPRRSSLFRAVLGSSSPAARPPRDQADTVRPPGKSSASRIAAVQSALDEAAAKPKLFRPSTGVELPSHGEMQLVGRGAAIDRVIERLLARASAAGVLLTGRPGAGKSRLLREITEVATDRGMLVVHWAAGMPPPSECSYTGLRALVQRLVGVSGPDPRLETGSAASTDAEALGLRTIFGADLEEGGAGPIALRSAVTAALVWAARGAAESVAPKTLVLSIDDLDHVDLVSQNALASLLGGEPVPGLRLVATSERAPGFWSGANLETLRVVGLSRVEAEQLLDGASVPASLGGRDDLEPLYIEHLLRWQREERLRPPPPARLADLIERRLSYLDTPARRALQAVAVAGGGTVASLSRILASPDDLDESLPALARAGWIERRGEQVSLTHSIVGRIVTAIAPAGALAELHERAADELAEQPGNIELRAYHAVRGTPDFAAFLLVEEAAARRSAHGDAEGAIAALWDGLRAARTEVLRGATETASAWIVFGHKLGAVLIDAGRFEEATGVLTEIVRVIPPNDIRRALLLEQLGTAAEERDRPDEARAMRSEALLLAERLDDRVVAERLRRALARHKSGARRQVSPPHGTPDAARRVSKR